MLVIILSLLPSQEPPPLRVAISVVHAVPNQVEALLSLGIVFIFFDSGYGYYQSLFMMIFFICVAHGNNLFKLLNTTPALFLGQISYSIYLLHCTVIYITINSVNLYLPISSLSELEYWLIVPMQGTITILLAIFSYSTFELPFMKSNNKKISKPN